MNLSAAAGTSSLTALFTALNGGTLNLYTGAPPANVAAVLSGNTLIGTADFAAAALSGSITTSGDNVTGNLAFTATTFTTAAAGTVTFARALNTTPGAVIDLGVSSPWLASTAVVLNQMASNGGNLYICTTAGTTAASGGPTGTGTGITDGTAVWSYVAPGVASVTLSNAAVTQSLTVTINSATLSLPITNPAGGALVT
ncbi:MAG: hypothetical protein ACYDDA_10805 [Acidiferrobacteraceae bacterium]